MTQQLHLYGRRDCHLCAEMKNALLMNAGGFVLLEFDVDEDPDLSRIYGARVPVLTFPDGTEICQYFLDEDALFRAMGLV